MKFRPFKHGLVLGKPYFSLLSAQYSIRGLGSIQQSICTDLHSEVWSSSKQPVYQILTDVFFFVLNTHACYYTGPQVTFYSVMKPVNMCLLFHSIWSQCVECHYSWEELYNVPIQPPSSSHIYLSFSLTATALLSSMLFALLFSPPSLRSIHSLTHSARCNG